MNKVKTDDKNLIKASLSEVRISPRKVKAAASNLKGLSVKEAFNFLDFNSLKASALLSKLVKSGYHNAMNKANTSISESDVIVKNVIIGRGQILKRGMPAGKGSSKPIKKKFSNISVYLEVMQNTIENNTKEEKKWVERLIQEH